MAKRAGRAVVWFPVVLLLVTSLGVIVAGDEARTIPQRVLLGPPVTPIVFDGDVRDLPTPRRWQPGDPVMTVPQRYYGQGVPRATELGPPVDDPLLARQLELAESQRETSVSFTTPSRDIPGQEATGLRPPDSVGDVGPQHYIQMVNGIDGSLGAQVRIFDKAEPAPNELASFSLSDLGTCGSFGDPIVLYDRQADRWLLSEFSSNVGTFCVYISQTGDPVTGGWYAYQFVAPAFPDYPKYAVWATDVNGGSGSYIVTTNEDPDPGVYALDRGAMLAGLAATFQRFAIPALQAYQIQSPIPADPDGPNPPPSGVAAVVMRQVDTEIHGGTATGDLLEMWLFDVDWIDPGNTTFIQTPGIDVTDFDSDVCDVLSLSCFPQPDGGTPLHALHEPMMHRLQYMNVDGVESLLGNFTVDVNGLDRGGVRWFELRRDGNGQWALFQEGTYSIDGDNRWMGSIAMDEKRNIALGFNVVSTTTYPSLRYTGRMVTDPAGMMTQPETTLGPGVAVEITERYGDYSSMNLDPVDDCTFWLTGEYSLATDWQTRIGSFKFENCPCDLAPIAPAVQVEIPGELQIDVLWDDSLDAATTEYVVRRARLPGGPFETLATVPDSSPGVAGGPGYVVPDTDVSGSIMYYYEIFASDGVCLSDPAAQISATATGPCTLAPVFAGLQSAASSVFDTCRVDLAWNPAGPECGGPATFDVYRSTTPGFVPGPADLLVSGLATTTVSDVNDLLHGQTYAYVVRAVDQATGTQDTNLVERSVTVGGPGSGVLTLLDEKFEAADAFDAWTVTSGPGPHRCGDWVRTNSGSQRPAGGNAYYALALSESCDPTFPLTSTRLDSPLLDLALAGVQSVTLEVDLYYNHLSGDDATIEVWDGAAWRVVWNDPDADVNERLTLDVSAEADGNPAFQVRFSYQNANDQRWYAVDNVKVVALVDNPCTTAAAPAPAPDGEGLTEPLRAARLDVAGTTIGLTWDVVTCAAPAYNLLWGDLASVALALPAGSECAIGNGTFDWTAAPASDLYFLVVGHDGASTESSWGRATQGERNALDPSGECGTTQKNISNTCIP